MVQQVVQRRWRQAVEQQFMGIELLPQRMAQDARAAKQICDSLQGARFSLGSHDHERLASPVVRMYDRCRSLFNTT
jgi:hypothetical protein